MKFYMPHESTQHPRIINTSYFCILFIIITLILKYDTDTKKKERKSNWIKQKYHLLHTKQKKNCKGTVKVKKRIRLDNFLL